MAIKVIYIEYTMSCTSQAAYNTAKGILGGITTLLAPVTAAALVGGIGGYSGSTPPANSIIFGISAGNIVYATELQPGNDITQAANHIEFNPAAGSYDDGKFSYSPFHILPCGLAAITVNQHYPAYGPDQPVTFQWSGTLLLAAAGAPSGPAKRYLGARRWVDGFELPAAGGGGTSGERDSGVKSFTRDASRTIDGFGCAIRCQTGNNVLVQQLPNPSGNALTYPSTSWERFYLRVRAFPTSGADEFWAAHGIFEGAGDACLLTISSTGVVSMYNCGNLTFPGNLLATGPTLSLNTWYRFDLRIHFKTSPTDNGAFYLYINGAPVHLITVPHGSGTGLDNNGQTHTASLLGVSSLAAAPHNSAFDFDDWISADEVVNPPGDPGNFPGVDLSSGSHVVAVHATGFGAAHNSGAWTGDWRSLNQRPPTTLDATTAHVTGSTPSAQIEVTTDYAAQGDGCAAFIVAGGAAAIPAASTGQIGWKINGVQTLFPYTSAVGFNQAFPIRTVPSGTLANALPLISLLDLEFQAPVAAGTTTMQALMAAAEMIGVFGTVDNDPSQPPVVAPPFSGIHNNPYPAQASAALASPPALVPVGVVSMSAGLYTGNNIGQDVFEQIAAHWWWVRDITAGGGICWWSSMMAAHPRNDTDMASSRITRAHLLSGAPSMEVAGSTPEANESGHTYQWVAIADPAMRYLLNAANVQAASDTPTFAHPLVNGTFTPIAAMFVLETYSGGGALAPYYKGPGATGNNASPLTGSQQANILTLSAGSYNTLSAANWNNPQLAAAFFRLDDGTGNHWLDITSYVGNGAGGTRDIPVNLNGRFPLFVLAVPHNDVSYFRDPSHVGANSTNCSTNGLNTTAIVGGNTNIVTVGATLNTNGVVYDLFVLPGDTLFGNILDGSGNPSSFTPVPIDPGPQGPYNPPPTPTPPPGAGCISFAQAILELQTRLGDTLGIHWTILEIIEYLKEALHVYNALTLAYKGRGSFVAMPAQVFYELPVELPALRSYTILDQDEIRLLQYHIMEPPTPTGWTGTAQFTLDDLTQTLQRRLDLYKFETGQVITEEIVAVTPDTVGRVALPLMVTDLRRVAWASQSSPVVTPVLRASEWDMNAYARAWPTAVGQTPTRPLGYSVSAAPPLVLQLGPPPTVIGNLDVLAVVRCPDLSPATGVLLGIPDDFCWVPKWGALMDILSTSGPAGDPTRMAMAQILWDQGVAAARRSAVVLDARIDAGLGQQIVPVNAVSEADYYLRNWQTTTGTPRRVLLAGHNLVALTPVPDNLATYTVYLNVICNIPIPATLGDCYYEGGAAVTAALLDYAEFLANFKEGPAQARAAFPLLQRFFTVCGVAVDLQSALMPQRGAMLQQTAQDERSPATFTEPAEPVDH